MNPNAFARFPSWNRQGSKNTLTAARLLVASLGWLLLGCGCSSFSPGLSMPAAPYRPANVFVAQKTLPATLRRLAVLPLTTRPDDATSEAGRDSLQAIMLAELGKTKAFDIQVIKESELRQWTGKSRWSSEERLPEHFFTVLRERAACDGVLFGELTQYRAYPPLAIGWRFKLLDTQEKKTWWSIDEVFDAGQPAVAGAAAGYYRDQMHETRAAADSQSQLHSPRRFGQYTLSASFGTLPSR